MASPVLSFAVLSLLSVASAGLSVPTTQQGIESRNCATCMWATSSLQEVLGHLDLQPVIVSAVQAVCKSIAGSADAQQCSSLAETLVPEAMGWLRRPEAAVQMCSAAHVCSGATMPSLTEVGMRQVARESVRNDVMCNMCEHVVSSAQGTVRSSMTQAQLTERGMAACTELPGDMVATCARMVELYTPQIMPVVDRMDAWSSCAVAGLCTSQLLDHMPVAALPAALVEGLIPMQQIVTQAQKANGEVCDGCRMAMLELNLLVTNPVVQDQLTGYAKSLCSSLGAAASDTCKHYVDLYGPAIFQQLQQYLQTDIICQGIGMCSKTTTVSSVAAVSTISTALQQLAVTQAQKQMLRAQPSRDELLRGQQTDDVIEVMGQKIAMALKQIFNSRSDGRGLEAQTVEAELAESASATPRNIDYTGVYNEYDSHELVRSASVLGGVEDASALVGGVDEIETDEYDQPLPTGITVLETGAVDDVYTKLPQVKQAPALGADDLYESLAEIGDEQDAGKDGPVPTGEGVDAAGPYYDVYYAGYYDSAYQSEYDQWVDAAATGDASVQSTTPALVSNSKTVQETETQLASTLASNAKWLDSFWSKIVDLGGSGNNNVQQAAGLQPAAAGPQAAAAGQAMAAIQKPALQRTAGSGKGSGMKSMKPMLMMGQVQAARKSAARKLMA